MLTKDLTKARKRGDRIFPILIDPDDQSLLASAHNLIETFQSQKGQRIGDISELINLTHIEQPSIKAALVKLLFDQSELCEDDTSIEVKRWEIMNQAEAAKAKHSFKSYGELVQEVAKSHGVTADELKELIYSDLPDCRRLSQVPDTTPKSLLHRYNCAQVQALLLRSESVRVTFKADIATRRSLLRSLKFQRLLAEVTVSGEQTILNLSGPMSLFSNAQSYGLRIAIFFPYILQLSEWDIEAKIKDSARKFFTLKIDHTCQITSHYKERIGYIPEEFQLCLTEFNQRYKGKALAEVASEFIHIGSESYCFPDFTIQRSDQQTPIHVEIFHRWHASQLNGRLEALSANPRDNLRLAVDQSLIKNERVAHKVKESAWFHRYGFSFNNFPTPKKIWESLACE